LREVTHYIQPPAESADVVAPVVGKILPADLLYNKIIMYHSTLQIQLERFNVAILGCEPLCRHEGFKIVQVATHSMSFTNTWQLHSKMWMTLLDGRE
jgi:hypothetical protein